MHYLTSDALLLAWRRYQVGFHTRRQSNGFLMRKKQWALIKEAITFERQGIFTIFTFNTLV